MNRIIIPLQNERGAVLITALLVFVMLALTGLYTAYQATTEMHIAVNGKLAVQAFYAAEGGIEDSRMQLTSIAPTGPSYDSNWRAFVGSATEVSILFPGEPDYSNIFSPQQNQIHYNTRIRHKTEADYGADLNGDGDQTDVVMWADTDGDGNSEQNANTGLPVEILTSVGSIGSGASSAQKRITVELVRLSSSPFKYGIFGDNYLRMTGNGLVDSYLSSNGLYSVATRRSNGDVASNSIANAAISLTGNSDIYGDAAVGVGGNPGTGIDTKNADQIKGATGSLSEVQDMTPLDDPGGGSNDSLNLSGNSSKTFSSGEYRLPSINISGNGDAYINGDVIFYVSGNISISGNGRIHIQPGCSLKIYASGSIDIAGNGFINETNLPDRLLIYGTESCTNVNISGNGDLYGGLYAPKADVSISGNGDIYGSVIGKSLTITGNGSVHYDEKLANIPVKPAEFKVLTWREE